MSRWTSSARFFVALMCASISAASGQAAGPTGPVVGQVITVDSRSPLQGAQITILGTTLRATTNADGRYTVRNVPAGSHTVRVQMLGFEPKESPANVTANGNLSVNFEMKDIPYSVAPVVTTALGIAREEKGLGYATTSISSSTLEKIPEK